MTIDDAAGCMAELTGRDQGWVNDCLLAMLGDGTQIYLEYHRASDELYLYGNVASISEERFGRYALSLLKANYFGKETGGTAVLAYDADESRVVIWDRMTLSQVSPKEFKDRFSMLYLSKLHWTNKMRTDLLGGDLFDAVTMPAVYSG